MLEMFLEKDPAKRATLDDLKKCRFVTQNLQIDTEPIVRESF